MWFIKSAPLLITLALTGCATTVVVEMAVLPATSATAKIKQLTGDKNNSNPASCSLPCSVTVDQGSNYEVSFEALGYYPAVVQFDWVMAWNTSIALDLSKSNGNRRTPLIIPLIQRKVVKDKVAEDSSKNSTQLGNNPNTKEFGKSMQIKGQPILERVFEH